MKQFFSIVSLFCLFFLQHVWSDQECTVECQEEMSQQVIHRVISARPLTYQDSDVRETPDADEAYSWPGRRGDDFYDEFTR